MERTTGTTIFATRFNGGVVLGCDTRMTLGAYICNRACEKIIPIYDNVYLARCGSVADCQTISDYVRFYVEQHAIAIGDIPNVKTVANLVKMTIYQNKQHIEGSLIVGGWDKELGGQVYGVTIGGFLVDEKFHVDGSGSTYAWGLCDEMYKENMTEAEAQEFAMFTLSTAMGRDVASGGMARLVIVTATGGERKLIKPQEFPVYPGEMPFPKQDIVMTDS